MKLINRLYKINNNESVDIRDIPVFNYDEFRETMIEILNSEDNHCANYFAYKVDDNIRAIACVADDSKSCIYLLSYLLPVKQIKKVESITPVHPALHIFEREIYENYGIEFNNHPWLKPVRYPFNRHKQDIKVNDYPFYSFKSNELHEIGVGPIHAGIIEPGHFRFICNGENVLHLEIQLGWQHRGIENLILQKKTCLEKTIVAENIAGDTVIGHTTAFAQVMEALGDVIVDNQLALQRSLAMELERIAIHVGDISALCVDVAYHLGANQYSVLRTGIINFMQKWCGNRLGKGLVRVGGTNFSFNENLEIELLKLLSDFENRFNEISAITYHLPSIENRFDNIGAVSKEQAHTIGAVGMAARMTGLKRDIRYSHPYAGYLEYKYEPVILLGGDVFARFLLRRKEIKASIKWIRQVLGQFSFKNEAKHPYCNLSLRPNMFAISLTEGWRGEICHCGLTDKNEVLVHYKVKDPSVHNWKALELSLRNLEISDFPINNKSYNLSYCGHDL